MKKFLKIGLFLLMLSCMFPVMVHAQDGTDPVNDFLSYIWDFIPVKYKSISFTVITGLYLFEQFLAATTKIKANSSFQLVASWISNVFKAVKLKFNK